MNEVAVNSGIQSGGTNDGVAYGVRMTREKNQLTAFGVPALFELTRQGRVFTGNIAAAGVILPIYSNTAQQVGLWNPVGSGVDLLVLRLSPTYVDTSGAAGGYVIGQLTNAPAAVGTGLAITAFTETAAIPAYNGAGYAAKAKFGQGATLTVTTPTIKQHLGLNQNAFTAAGTGQMPYRADYQFDGDLVVTPGTAIFVAGLIATLAKFSGSLAWAEIDRV